MGSCTGALTTLSQHLQESVVAERAQAEKKHKSHNFSVSLNLQVVWSGVY